MRRCLLSVFGTVALILAFLRTPVTRADNGPQPNTPIHHLIVLMQQNHTFDNYFGAYEGADGMPPGTCMPVYGGAAAGDQCIEPFHLEHYPDLDHSRTTFFRQYNHGGMDGFVSALRSKGQDGRLAMGYYDDRDLPYYWNLADEYVLFDRFFSSAHGGSIQNRMYSVAAVPASPQGRIPASGYGDVPTVFDRLQENGISWKYYVRNYDPELNYRTLGGSGMLEPQVQWLPLLGFDRFIDDPELSGRIVDLEEFFIDVQRGSLPAVSYVLGMGATEHPPSNLRSGQRLTKALIQALMKSDAWERSAFLLTYDDWGGWYDHVIPPQVDEFGYGFRVPALLVSPLARRGHVDSTELDFCSILRFIEENWDLAPLSHRDASANSLMGAFDLGQSPRQPRLVPWARPATETSNDPRRDVIFGGYGAALVLALAVMIYAVRGRDGRECGRIRDAAAGSAVGGDA